MKKNHEILFNKFMRMTHWKPNLNKYHTEQVIYRFPVNTNISANIGPILGRQHNCRHCWPDNNRYRATIGPMLTEFNIICADNWTADADEISETDIGPMSAHCRHVCCCPNISIQYWPNIGSFSEVVILVEYWHTISARY